MFKWEEWDMDRSTADQRRVRPDLPFDWKGFLSTVFQLSQTTLFFLVILWLFYLGIEHIEYRWQWNRTLPFFFKIIDSTIIWGPLPKGLLETLRLSAIAGALSIVIGFITAFTRLSDSIMGRMIATAYLEIIRNTPLLVQLFLFYFVLSPIFDINRFWAGVLCLSFFEGSFAAEIIRGGIISVDKGQFEAADAMGFTRFDKYRYIIIPQALPLILPPLTGLLISLIKHSAIVSVIAIAELTTAGLNLISDTFMAFEIWFIVAGIYLVLTFGLSLSVTLLESKLTAYKH
jgi:polar amino acid transport system permease protein